jgi:hypothetical protein
VKSGKEEKLKSLHLFMDESPGKIAIRLYAGELLVTKVVTPNGKMITYYYLVSQLPKHIDWLNKDLSKKSKK